MEPTPPLAHLLVLLIALPFQLGLAGVNARVRWFTPGELRFWGIAVFVLFEIIYLAIR
jgi:hypothetical protein